MGLGPLTSCLPSWRGRGEGRVWWVHWRREGRLGGGGSEGCFFWGGRGTMGCSGIWKEWELLFKKMLGGTVGGGEFGIFTGG